MIAAPLSDGVEQPAGPVDRTPGGPGPANLTQMSDSDYFALPALNHSSLRWLLEDTPAHFRFRMDNPAHTPTSDMEFGTAVHSLVLGGPEIVRVDADSWRTNAAKEAKADAHANGQVALLTADYERAGECAEAVSLHPVAAKLLATADHRESVALWEMHGIPCKAKIDGISGRFVWDLKTTYQADTESFGRSAAKYGYHTQQAWYERAAKAVGISEPRFLFVVVEKEPPYLVNVIQLDSYDVELAHRSIDRVIGTYLECANADRWPGYGDGVNVAQLPRWAEIEMENQ